MKKIFWRIAGVVGVLFLGVFIFFAYALHVHNEAMGEFKPYTLDELHALSELLDPPGSPGMVLPEGLPTKLNSVPSEEEMVRKVSAKRRKDYMFYWWVSLSFKVEDGVARLQGRDSLNGVHTPSGIGNAKEWVGDLESARQYYWISIDAYKTTDPKQCKYMLWALSRIERDPEKAVLLMHLSHHGAFRNIKANDLFWVYSFCKKRDSHELADYYLERLWDEFPVEAKRYEINSEIPSITISP